MTMVDHSHTPQPLNDAMARSVAAVRGRFVASLADRAAELDALMVLAETEADARRFFLRAVEIVHRIAGVARTLGFSDLGDLAFEAERRLGTALTPAAVTTAAETAIEAVDHVVSCIDQITLSGQTAG